MKIFYHNDADGRCSAYIVRAALQEALDDESKDFFEMDYATPFPIEKIQKGETVYIVDYSINPEMMLKLLDITPNVVWIDHHKSAIEKYRNFLVVDINGLRKEYGMSGCMLTWKYFYGSMTPPIMVQYIDDWDIWKHEMDGTKSFITAFNSVDTNPLNDDFWKYNDDEDMVKSMIDSGNIMLQYRDGWAEDVIKHIGFSTVFEGLKVFAADIPHANSEFFNSIDKAQYDAFMPFYYDGNKKIWTYSMYATHEHVDVSKACVKHGGGGHRGAAGFTTHLPPELLFGVFA